MGFASPTIRSLHSTFNICLHVVSRDLWPSNEPRGQRVPHMKAMILAAGYGTRLRPVTYTMPKPIVPLAGRPLMGWAVEALLAAGIRDFVVNLHHLPERIERYLRDRYAGL